MKKIIFVFALALLFSILSQNCLAVPLSVEQEQQKNSFFKSRVSTITLYFYPIIDGQETWADLVFYIHKPATEQTIELDVGDYRLYSYAGDGNTSFFRGETNPLIKILEGKKSKVKIKFVPCEALLVPVVIDAPRGDYEEGKSYEVKILSNSGTGMTGVFSENDLAVYQDGKLSFHVWSYGPYDTESVLNVGITDRHGTENKMKFNFNIMDLVAEDYQPLVLEPKSGEVEIEVGYADESTLIVGLGEETPQSQLLTYGLSMVATAEFTFKAVANNFTVKELDLELPTAAAACATGGVALFEAMTASAVVGRSVFIVGPDLSQKAYAHFYDLVLKVPKLSSKNLIIGLNLNQWENSCLIDGVNVQNSLIGFKARNEDTGEEIVWNKRIDANPMYVYKTYPTITSISNQQTLGGNVTLNKTNIAGSMFGFVDWAEITYTVEKSPAVSIESVGLYNAMTNERIEGSIFFEGKDKDSTRISITFIPAIPQTVSSDGTTYALQAVVRGVTFNSYISTWIDQASSYAAPDYYVNVIEVSPSSSFVWSDRSVVPYDINSKSWNNGYLINGLPTTKQILTR